jgi:hypothetical protein
MDLKSSAALSDWDRMNEVSFQPLAETTDSLPA